MSRLKEKYHSEVVPSMIKEFGYESIMAVPRIKKVVLNMGLGEAIQNIKTLDSAVEELTMIAGQRAVITKARKSIAGYKLPKSVEFRHEPLPLSAAMKVLKRELREPYWEGMDRHIG